MEPKNLDLSVLFNIFFITFFSLVGLDSCVGSEPRLLGKSSKGVKGGFVLGRYS